MGHFYFTLQYHDFECQLIWPEVHSFQHSYDGYTFIRVMLIQQKTNVAVKGFSEIVGTFIGLYLILYTRRKWIWVGLLNIAAGLCTYTVWLIPSTSNTLY